VTDRVAVEAAVAKVEQTLGPVDVLVNNAGVSGPIGPLAESNPDDWWRCMEVNLRGPLLCTHAVLPGDGGELLTLRAGRVRGQSPICRPTSPRRRP
jgi:NADP-dependent 3-hydroxy acid dehydrogenase YdfG